MSRVQWHKGDLVQSEIGTANLLCFQRKYSIVDHLSSYRPKPAGGLFL